MWRSDTKSTTTETVGSPNKKKQNSDVEKIRERSLRLTTNHSGDGWKNHTLSVTKNHPIGVG